ncbi:transmembrane protein 69 [Bufo gargarizans]|uniref:transmembrane protein 69 n=1 Tax=Bufo gargarizans TaxID=30331 RepID=UPI001CF3CAD9|nr:transmembrane protein 69 [Bufo gargarizans]
MLRLGVRCRPVALQLCKMAAPVCRQWSHEAVTWRTRAPAVLALPCPQRSPLLLARGLHTSCSLHKRRRNPEDEEFSQTLQSYRQELRKTPRPAVYLSVTGLVPVVVAPLTMCLGGYYYPEMAFLQLAAANCLLSFYGGIRWGISVPENSPIRPDSLNLGLGALLPLVAWMSLIGLDNISVAGATVIGGMLLGAVGGVGMLPPYPVWLSFLRAASFLVTTCAILVTLWLSAVYPEKSLKNQSPK